MPADHDIVMYEIGNLHVNIMISQFLLFSMSDVIVIISSVFKKVIFNINMQMRQDFVKLCYTGTHWW